MTVTTAYTENLTVPYAAGDPIDQSDVSGLSYKSCAAAITRLIQIIGKEKSVIARYVRGLNYNDGDLTHVKEFKAAKRQLNGAARNARQECGRGGGPPGGLAAAYHGAMNYANFVMNLPYPGTSDSGWHFRLPSIPVPPRAVIVGGGISVGTILIGVGIALAL